MKLVYVAHPLGSGPSREANRLRAARWVAWVGDLGYAPVADWIIITSVWDESRREEGLAIDRALVVRCDELWLVGGRVSEGMTIESREAFYAKIPIRDLTELGDEPPEITPYIRAMLQDVSDRSRQEELIRKDFMRKATGG